MGRSTGRPSRAPLYVTVGFFTIAIVLVLLALRRPGPAAPVIDRPGTPDAPRTVAVILRDYLFDPTPLHVVRGETVRFEIFNGGLEPHEFVLGDGTVQAAWRDANAAATPPAPLATPPPASVSPEVGGLRVLLPSGARTSVVWTIPAQGELQLMCHLLGHVEQGMVGNVVSVASDRERSPAPSR